MAKKVSKNPLSDKLKAKFNKLKGEKFEMPTSGGNFPAGIEPGVAQIKSIKIDTYKQGKLKSKPYFAIRGVCVLPKKLEDGTPVEGCQDTLVMIPLCATDRDKYKKEEDGLGEMLGILQNMGVDTDEVDFDDLEEHFAAAIEEGLYCRFRTWIGKKTKEFPNPRVNVVYNGTCEFDGDSAEEDDELVDNTEDEEVEDEEVEDEEEQEEEETEEEESEEEEEEEDLDALGEAADEGDGDAQEKLQTLAEEAGISKVKLKKIATWAEVATLIAETLAEAEEGEEEEEEEEEEVIPTKGDVFMYKDPKAPKKKAVEVEITLVTKSKKTCNVKDLSTNKVIKDVSWSSLTAS